ARRSRSSSRYFFFDATTAPAIYTLSLHDALPISNLGPAGQLQGGRRGARADQRVGDRAQAERHPAAADHLQRGAAPAHAFVGDRSEEHTSELQSLRHLVCRLLLEKKKIINQQIPS